MDKHRQLDEIFDSCTDLEYIEKLSYLLAKSEKRNIEIVDDENSEWKLLDIFYDSIKDSFRFVTEEGGNK